MRIDVSRMPLVDTLKAIACLLIVAHHLSIYGPMSDLAYPLIPGLLEWLREYGRMAVQVFFVVAGFLLAGKLVPLGAPLATDPIPAIKRRYLRLVIPYLAALILAIGCAALARHWMTHDSIPAAPNLFQFLAHVFLLQDLLDQEALSAGVWYVAIDFQLFTLAAFLFWLSGKIEQRHPQLRSTALVLIAGLTMVSLFAFNRNAFWDETALYFFGSYGLGILAYWASGSQRPALWLALLGALAVAALLVDFRDRIAVATVVMLLLGCARHYGILTSCPVPDFLTYLGRISYSIFLVHFPLCMVVNASFFRFLPHEAVTSLFGLVLALGISILGGALFYKWIESRPLADRMRLLLFPAQAGQQQ
ncbi:MAG: acyltransferase [Nitrosospira sp.]|nr:acyltransferase [Nitrosospira sp.]